MVGAKLSADEDTLGDMIAAVLESSKWLDEPDNRKKAATTLALENYVNTPAANIEGRLTGKYELGGKLGSKDFAGRQMQFFQNGAVNSPRRAHTIWALAQYQRFGLLKTAPNYQALADKLVLRSMYEKAAKAAGVAVPDDDMTPLVIQLDNVTFDPTKPAAEASRP